MKFNEIPKTWVAAVALVGVGMAAASTWSNIQHAPETEAHVGTHHDSIVDLAETASAIQGHVIAQEAINASIEETLREIRVDVSENRRDTDYLACWRGEREWQRVNPDAPPRRDCEQELLERGRERNP